MRKPDKVVVRITHQKIAIVVRRGDICARRDWVPADRDEGRWRPIETAPWKSVLWEGRDEDLIIGLDDMENSAFYVAEGLA